MISLLLLACAPDDLPATTITGLQVVAIETTPAQPSGDEPLTIEAWVADGLGHGADVLVWSCLPVDGVCAESRGPVGIPGVSSPGVPLSLWTRVGRAAGASFRTEVSWPFLATLAADLASEASGPPVDTGWYPDTTSTETSRREPLSLVVWALACAPGICPLVDAVAAEPVPGSDAWRRVVADLADPARWMGDVPPGDASVAVKTVPLWDAYSGAQPYLYGDVETANRKPVLELVEADEASDPPREARFLYYDPDPGDRVSARAFTTGGAVDRTATSAGDLYVTWTSRGPRGDPSGATRVGENGAEVFVVLEDGRGGTEVWSTAVDGGPCGLPPVAIPQHRPGARIEPGDGLPLRLDEDQAWLDLSGRAEGLAAEPREGRIGVSTVSGLRLGAVSLEGFAWDPATCSASLGTRAVRIGEDLGRDGYCALGGTPVEVTLEVDGVAASVVGVLTLSAGAGCFE